jgi:hypothetical protein
VNVATLSGDRGALSQLRQFFGDELLVPVGSQMMLTPHAIGVQEQVRDIILRAEAIARNKTAFVPKTATRHFRLIMSDYPATVLMPRVLAQAEKTAPGLTFEIVHLSDPDSDALERGEADLYEDRYVCVVWSGHNTWKRRFSRAEYLRAGHVGVRFPGRPLPVMEEWLDPEYDTPAVFRAFGERTISGADRFSNWDLATGSADEVRRLRAGLV